MSQLIQVMRLTYLITKNEPTKSTSTTRQNVEEVIADEKHAQGNNKIYDWEEKYVFLRRWISGTLIKEIVTTEEHPLDATGVVVLEEE